MIDVRLQKFHKYQCCFKNYVSFPPKSSSNFNDNNSRTRPSSTFYLGLLGLLLYFYMFSN